MSTKVQAKTQAKTPAAPAAARIPQHPVAVPEHEAVRPDIAAQLEGAVRLGHSLGAVGVDGYAPPIIQRQEIPEEEEEELQLKREPAAVQRQEIPEEEEEELQLKREPAVVQRQEIPEEEEEELMLKPAEGRVGPQGGRVPPEVEAAIQRARGGGQPLAGALQEQMSASLGHDFSRVRVHTDSEAEALTQQIQAKAFTTGPDIFFKRGAYDPYARGGRELIAHELWHVVQQGSGCVNQAGGSGRPTVHPSSDVFEVEARAKASEARRGEPPLGRDRGGLKAVDRRGAGAWDGHRAYLARSGRARAASPKSARTKMARQPSQGGVIQRDYGLDRGVPGDIQERQYATSAIGAVVFSGISSCIGLVRRNPRSGRVTAVHLSAFNAGATASADWLTGIKARWRLGGAPDVVVGDTGGWRIPPGPEGADAPEWERETNQQQRRRNQAWRWAGAGSAGVVRELYGRIRVGWDEDAGNWRIRGIG